MNYSMLRKALDAVCAACEKEQVSFTPSYEESDLQSVFVMTKDPSILGQIEKETEDALPNDFIVFDTRRVRGGTIISLSLGAINEREWDKIIDAYHEERDMSYIDFLSEAKRILESQYKSATSGVTRSNQSSRQRNMYNMNMSIGGVHHPNCAAKQRGVLSKRIDKALANEDLNGIATPTDKQPGDLFDRFGKALKILGDQLGLGPLQDSLKQQGINYKLSSDKQSIILYVINATTRAPQALLRIPAEALDEPHEMEEQLLNMLDFAKGDAPGALKQQQQAIQAQEKAVRDIVKAFEPKKPEETDVIKGMIDNAPAEAAATAADVKGRPGVTT